MGRRHMPSGDQGESVNWATSRSEVFGPQPKNEVSDTKLPLASTSAPSPLSIPPLTTHGWPMWEGSGRWLAPSLEHGMLVPGAGAMPG